MIEQAWRTYKRCELLAARKGVNDEALRQTAYNAYVRGDVKTVQSAAAELRRMANVKSMKMEAEEISAAKAVLTQLRRDYVPMDHPGRLTEIKDGMARYA